MQQEQSTPSSQGHKEGFSRIDHMLDPKANLKHLNGLNKTNYECILTSYREKLAINKERKFGEFTNNMEIKQLTSK